MKQRFLKTLTVVWSLLCTTGVVAGVLFLSACKPAYISEERELADRARNSVNPTNLQAWATAYLSSHSASQRIELTNLPTDVRNLYSYDPKAFVQDKADDAQAESCIVVVWGSGFGHRGFLIGSKQYRPIIRDNELYVEEWIPGVYFSSETR